MRQWKPILMACAVASLSVFGSGARNASAQSTTNTRNDASRASLNIPPLPSRSPGASTVSYTPSAYAPGSNAWPAAPGTATTPPGEVLNRNVPPSDVALSHSFEPVPNPKPAKRPSVLRRLFGARTTASATEAPKRKHVKHPYIDPSTGSTKLPLSKPWLKPVW